MKTLIFGAYKHSGLMRFQSFVRRQTHPAFVSILLFHRVTDQIPADGLTVGTDWFRDFCQRMQSGYHVLTLDEVERLARTGEPPPPRAVAITFDDCYADNLAAAEMLSEHGLSASFFVPTNFISTPHRFWWDEHLPPMPNLTWDDLRRMARLGHCIESHSASHADFSKLSDEEALAELVHSRRAIEEQIGRAPRWFAFPFGAAGNCPKHHAELVAKAGYAGSFSAMNGFVEPTVLGSRIGSTILPRVATQSFHNLTRLELHIQRSLDWLHASHRATSAAE